MKEIKTPMVGMKVQCVETQLKGIIIHPSKDRSMLVEFGENHKKYIYKNMSGFWGYGYCGRIKLMEITE